MTLQGSLQQLGLAGVLQNALAGREGTLYLRNGTSRAVLHVDGHQLRLLEPDDVDPSRLLEGFLHRGLLTSDTFEEALRCRDDPVGVLDHLVDSGALPRPELDRVLRGVAEDTILELLTWDAGDFRFQERETLPQHEGLVSRVGADIGGILLRAAQRLDERNAIKAGLGKQPHLFFVLDQLPTPENAEDPVVEVHALLDGNRVVGEIALLAGISRFATLKAVLRCVQSGCARAATPDELRAAAESREAAGEARVARDLLMQWAGTDVGATEPLERLAALAHAQNQPDEEGDALLTLGHVHLQHGRPDQALPILLQLVRRRPGDMAALTALSTAAEAAGQFDLFSRTVTQLAETALRNEEPERAAGVLTRLVSMPDAPLSAHVLRARAFVQLRDRERLVSEIEAARRTIGDRATSREQTEALSFFRDAVLTLLPERTDLLRLFRNLLQDKRPRRRVALLLALLLLVATGGYLLWPKGAGKLLGQARAAVARGDDAEATRLIGRLADEFPDAPETAEGFLLLATLESKRQTDRPRSTETLRDPEVEAALKEALAKLGSVPAAESTAALQHLAELLAAPDGRSARQTVVDRMEPALLEAGQSVVRDVRQRLDLLGRARDLASAPKHDFEALGAYLERVDESLDSEYPQRLYATCDALDAVVGTLREKEVGRTLRAMRKSADRLSRSWSSGANALEDCRRRYASLDLDRIHDLCRTEASKHLVAGRFDEAEKLYEQLADKIEAIKADPNLAPLLEDIVRRRMPEFLADRQSMMKEIRDGLQSARASEEAGDLEAAVRAYVAVTKKFWHVRFEGVIRLPLRVTSVPEGAHVLLNGQDQGVTPVVVHYAWGSQITLTVQADGYEPANQLLTPGNDAPPADLAVDLVPHSLWAAPLDPTVIIPPVGVGEDVLVCSRAGRVTLHGGRAGKVHWARHIETLEGMRARPAVSGGIVYLPHLDGTLWFVDVKDGRPLGSLAMRRPAGDAAAIDTRVAIASQEGYLQILLRRRLEAEVSLDGRPTAGVVAAHDAWWTGTAEGYIVRVLPNRSHRRVALPGRRVPVLGLAAFEDGIVATKGDGTLHALDSEGDLLWTAEAVGDAVGNPTVAGDVVAVVDSRARILLFDLENGDPRGQVDLQSAARFGLATVRGCLVAFLDDGRIWIYDPRGERTIANVDLGGEVRFEPAPLGKGRIAVPAEGDTLRILTVPGAPER